MSAHDLSEENVIANEFDSDKAYNNNTYRRFLIVNAYFILVTEGP